MANFVKHVPCENCGSSDAGAEYDDGSFHCHACGHHPKGEGAPAPSSAPDDWKPVTGHYEALSKRRLTEKTLRFWGYQIGEFKGQPAQIKNYKDEHGKLLGQKFRLAGKEFRWIGDKGASELLFGMWLWPSKGKSITITEGELDAMSLSEAWDNQWPVVSLPNGSQSVKKCFKRCYDYLNGFDSIILMFDMDEPGREAVDAALELLPAGKVKIATLPEKDANEVLVKHGPGVLVKCFWDAKLYRPDGIISGKDLDLEDLMSTTAMGFSVRDPRLNEMLLGLRKAEITLLTAGSGIGKSTKLRQVCYELKVDHGLKIGNVYLEEKNKKTAQAYIALDNSVPLGRLRHNTSIITPEQWARSKREIVDDMCFYNHFGSLESSRLLSKLHYMAMVEKCDFIALDHISIVTSGMESSSEGERKDIDILMTRLRQLVEETGVGILGVVHLKRAQGKNFNEGSSVSLTDLRGSAALEQLSDNVISLERDQQDKDKKDVMLCRVLKCRETGDTGEADTMQYDRQTGRIEQYVDTGLDADLDAEVKDEEAVPF